MRTFLLGKKRPTFFVEVVELSVGGVGLGGEGARALVERVVNGRRAVAKGDGAALSNHPGSVGKDDGFGVADIALGGRRGGGPRVGDGIVECTERLPDGLATGIGAIVFSALHCDLAVFQNSRGEEEGIVSVTRKDATCFHVPLT